jgi:small subunit ribosomal protein S16
MALVIRLRQQGRSNRHSFRLVLTERTAPRDGKYIENLGWYDPFMENDKNHCIKEERIQHWLDCGASLSPSAKTLVARAVPSLIKKLTAKSVAKKEKANKSKKKNKDAEKQ